MPALNAVVSEIEELQLESIIVAGDLVGGPKPNEAIELLRSLGCLMIVGNMEVDLLKFAKGIAPKEWYTIKQYGLMRWTHKELKPDILEFLENLPEQLVVRMKNAPPIKVVHGSPRNPYESIFPDRGLEVLRTAIEQTKEDVLVCGHIHIPWKKRINGKLVINPGAVSAPLNGRVGAQYGILEYVEGRWIVEHRIAKYDIKQIQMDYIESGLLEAGTGIAKAFLKACETGMDYGRQFIDYAFQLAQEAGYENIKYLPDDVWEQAIETFPWEKSG